MKSFGKRGIITGIIADSIPIVVSVFANNSIKNDTLRNIVYFCYSIRLELILVLALLFLVLILPPLLRKMWANDKYYVNRSIAVCCVIIGVAISFHSMKVFLVSRRDYYKNNYYLAQAQYLPFQDANELFADGYYEKAKEKYNHVIDLNDNGYYTFTAIRKIRQIDRIIAFRDNYYNYLGLQETEPPSLTQMEGLAFLANVFPGYYDYVYRQKSKMVRDAISEYPKFYEAVKNEEFAECQNLISKYGWCWFEGPVKEKFSDGSKLFLLRIWKEYISGESMDVGINRLRNKWSAYNENE